MQITSAQNPRVKALAKLADKKHRTETGLFWLEGDAYVAQALKQGWEADEIWVAEGTTASTTHTGTPHILTSKDVLAKITGKNNPQPVLGILRQRWTTLENMSLPRCSEAQAGKLMLALDRPRDPGNLGTIIRTADAAGAAGIILIGDSTDPFSPECTRATVGSILNIPLAHTTEAAFIAWSKDKHVIGTHLKATQSFRTIQAQNPAILLMGNESEGLTEALTAACTHLAKIPMIGPTESLNLATSTALMLYELRKGDLA